MDKDDFKVELDNKILSISSQKTTDKYNDHNNDYERREFSFQPFHRTFHLPDTAEVEKINAKYKDGILSLVIPKKEEK